MKSSRTYVNSPRRHLFGRVWLIPLFSDLCSSYLLSLFPDSIRFPLPIDSWRRVTSYLLISCDEAWVFAYHDLFLPPFTVASAD